MCDGKVVCAQRSLFPTPKTPRSSSSCPGPFPYQGAGYGKGPENEDARSCYAVICESKMDYFVVDMLLTRRWQMSDEWLTNESRMGAPSPQ